MNPSKNPQNPQNLLDELLAELRGAGKPTKTKPPAPSEPAEPPISALVARMLDEASWQTRARTIRATHQECIECSRVQSHIDGLFIKQTRGSSTRYVAKLHYTKIDLDNLPLEIVEFRSLIPQCFQCASLEVRLDQLLHIEGGQLQPRQIQLELDMEQS